MLLNLSNMKKLFVFLAAAVVFTSCQFIAETFYSTEDCAEWYCEKLCEVAENGSASEFKETLQDMVDYVAGLSSSEKIEFGLAQEEWFDDHSSKFLMLDQFMVREGFLYEFGSDEYYYNLNEDDYDDYDEYYY